MKCRWIVLECALILVIAIVAMSLVHAPSGPFTAVHGPATAFRGLRGWLLLVLAIVAASSQVVPTKFISAVTNPGSDANLDLFQLVEYGLIASSSELTQVDRGCMLLC